MTPIHTLLSRAMSGDAIHAARLKAGDIRGPRLVAMLGADARDCANDEPDTFAQIHEEAQTEARAVMRSEAERIAADLAYARLRDSGEIEARREHASLERQVAANRRDPLLAGVYS
jgi:uncharacterized protein YbjQ (UPF0145 family)